MTFNDWWKTYIADPGRADLRFNVQAETAALDAWEAAQAAQLPTGWPRASISDSCLGWTLDYKFLDKVEQIAKSRTEYSTSMEATEQVLIAALEVLATVPKAAPQPAENFWAQVDAMRSELAADIREVFDANGPETPQIVRDVIEYADSWLQVAIQRESERSAPRADLTRRAQAEPAHPTAGIWVPTELAERVQETMGEFLMDHGWRQQDMDTSDEFGALLAVATKAAPAPAAQGDAVDAAQRTSHAD